MYSVVVFSFVHKYNSSLEWTGWHDTKTIRCERAREEKRREIETEYKWTASHRLVITFVGFHSFKKKRSFQPTGGALCLTSPSADVSQSNRLFDCGFQVRMRSNFRLKEVGWTVDSNKRQSGVCCSSPARERTEESRLAPECRTLTPTRSRKPPATTLST